MPEKKFGQGDAQLRSQTQITHFSPLWVCFFQNVVAILELMREMCEKNKIKNTSIGKSKSDSDLSSKRRELFIRCTMNARSSSSKSNLKETFQWNLLLAINNGNLCVCFLIRRTSVLGPNSICMDPPNKSTPFAPMQLNARSSTVSKGGRADL